MSDAQRREQIESDAAFALRLQEEELRQVSYMLPLPAQGGLQDRRPAPYFFTGDAGQGRPRSGGGSGSSAGRAPGNQSRRSPEGVPDRQRMPYSYVNNPEPEPAPAPQFHHHTHFEFGTRPGGVGGGGAPVGGPATSLTDMMESFGMFFPQRAGGGGMAGGGGGGHRLGGGGGGPGGGPEQMTGAMADMLRMFETLEHGGFPGFMHGGPPPPRGGATFFMGTTGGPAPHVPGMDAMPPFFRQFFDQAPHATYEEFLDMIERRGNVNRGANDEELSGLRTMKWKDFKRARPKQRGGASSAAGRAAGVDEKEKCVVCLGEFEDEDDVTVLPCGHVFRDSCIKQWLRVNRTCPSCKRSIRPGDNEQQN